MGDIQKFHYTICTWVIIIFEQYNLINLEPNFIRRINDTKKTLSNILIQWKVKLQQQAPFRQVMIFQQAKKNQFLFFLKNNYNLKCTSFKFKILCEPTITNEFFLINHCSMSNQTEG